MFDLRSDLNKAIEHYPNLKIVDSDGKLSLSGEVDLFHPTEKKWIDSFSVDITYPERFPNRFPVVVETSGKIERIPNRHIYKDTNNMCFAVQAEELMKCRYGITTLWFLDNVLVPRLAEEYIVNDGGKYSHEFSHGPLGDFEFYFEKFKTKHPLDVIRYLKLVLNGGFPKHYEKCSCGSGLKFKKCHRVIFEELKGLGDGFLNYEINKLGAFLKTVMAKAETTN